MEQKNQYIASSRISYHGLSRFRMGASNLKVGLTRKYARWSGELIQVEKQIEQIEKAYSTIEDKKKRAAKLKDLRAATEVIMAEIDPKWKPSDTKPTLPNKQQLPWEHGAATRMAFTVLRESSELLSTQDIAKKVIERLGSDPEDQDLVDKVRNNLGNVFKTADKYVRNVGGRPSRWQIIPDDEIDDTLPEAPI